MTSDHARYDTNAAAAAADDDDDDDHHHDYDYDAWCITSRSFAVMLVDFS